MPSPRWAIEVNWLPVEKERKMIFFSNFSFQTRVRATPGKKRWKSRGGSPTKVAQRTVKSWVSWKLRHMPNKTKNINDVDAWRLQSAKVRTNASSKASLAWDHSHKQYTMGTHSPHVIQAAPGSRYSALILIPCQDDWSFFRLNCTLASLSTLHWPSQSYWWLERRRKVLSTLFVRRKKE